MKKPFKPNAADFLFHKFSVAKQPKERSLSKVESEIRMRILGLELTDFYYFHSPCQDLFRNQAPSHELREQDLHPYAQAAKLECAKCFNAFSAAKHELVLQSTLNAQVAAKLQNCAKMLSKHGCCKAPKAGLCCKAECWVLQSTPWLHRATGKEFHLSPHGQFFFL